MSLEIEIAPLQSYTLEVACDLGLLTNVLDPHFDDRPVPEAHLRWIIESPSHDILTARLKSGRVIGAAALSEEVGIGRPQAGLIAPGLGGLRWGHLEDFVVDPQYADQGAGKLLWNGMVQWCQDRKLATLRFETEEDRTAAVWFYKKRGATMIPHTNLDGSVAYNCVYDIPPRPTP